MIRNRCSPASQILYLAIGAFLICTVSAQAGSGSGSPVAASSNGVNAAVRSVQPAISGLFQVHTPRVWSDALDASGEPGANGVPDFLETWQAFRAREDSAILENAYAFRTIDGQGDEILYAGVQRTSSGGPSKVVFEFNQKPGDLLGSLRIVVQIGAAGDIGEARFESYSGDKPGKSLSLAILSGEGCSDAGTACVVANGALLEVGANLSRLLGESGKLLKSIRITTPEDSVVGTFSLAGVINGCVGDVGNLNNPSCTANDVQLTSVDPSTLVIIGPGCDSVPDHCIGGTSNGGACTTNAQCPGGGTCADTVDFTATGNFLAGQSQRYDIGLYIALDGDAVPPGQTAGDGAKFGLCERFAFGNDETNVHLDGDTCGDLQIGTTTALSFGPVRIACVDTNNDGKVDIFHCETWGNGADEVGTDPPGPAKPQCFNSNDVEAGTGSKCFCGILTAFCIAIPDTNACTLDVCQGECQPASGTGGSGTACTDSTDCTVSGETCQNIRVQHIPQTGQACGDSSSGICDNPDTCDASGVCQPNHVSATTTCRASAGQCDVAESCDANGLCPADGFAAATTTCVGTSNGGACDATDSCDGAGACVDGFSPATTTCRASSGQCDVAESCTGSSGACPADGFSPATTACTGTSNGGACDATDSCDGAGACVDGFSPATTTCRASTGQCDVAESCSGSSGACPANGFSPATTACTGTSNGGACDATDSCDGAGACVDGFQPATTVCRASSGQCDVAESCSGSSGSCPGNGFAPATTTCVGTSSGGACDGTDSCDGSGSCVDGFSPATTICRPAAGACDVPESCTGSSSSCPTDVNPTCGGQITPTATTCQDFTGGTAADLTQILYGVKGTKINNVAPGVLFYYTRVNDVSTGDEITIVQEKDSLLFPFLGVHQSQVVVYSTDCTKSSLQTTIHTNGSGIVTILITGNATDVDLVIGIKYNPGTVVGTTVGSPPYPTVHYDIHTELNGTTVDADADGLDIAPKP